jgi:hypothetical protein
VIVDWVVIGVGIAASLAPIALGAAKFASKVGTWIKAAGQTAEVAVEMTDIAANAEVTAEDVSETTSLITNGVKTGAKVSVAMKNLMTAAKISTAIGIASGLLYGAGKLENYLATDNCSHIPQIENFATTCLGASHWPNMSNWQLIDVRLADSLLLYGAYTTEPPTKS